MTRTILAAVAVALAATMTATALAAGTLKNPKTMVLQPSDFLPAKARVLSKYTSGASSQGGAGYTVTYRYTSGSATREVQSSVVVMKSRSLAGEAYRFFKGEVNKAASKLTLPKYGDEQFATYFFGEGELHVVRNTVLWVLTVRYDSDSLTKAQAIAELKRFGSKAMKRVGSG